MLVEEFKQYSYHDYQVNKDLHKKRLLSESPHLTSNIFPVLVPQSTVLPKDNVRKHFGWVSLLIHFPKYTRSSLSWSL